MGTPAKWARSPSPEQSMKVRARTATRPDFVSSSKASIGPAPVRRATPTANAWNSISAPQSSSSVVGRALEGSGVVGLRVRLAEDEVRLAEAAERTHALEQVVGDPVHDLADLAVHVGVQAAEVRDAGRGAHAAEKAVALDQQRARAMPCRRRRGGDAGRAAAEHDDVVFAEDGVVRAGSSIAVDIVGGERKV